MEEVDKAEDKEVEVEVILKMKKRKLVCRIGMTANKGEAKEIGQVAIGLSVLSDKHGHCVNEYRSAKCYNCGKANPKQNIVRLRRKRRQISLLSLMMSRSSNTKLPSWRPNPSCI